MGRKLLVADDSATIQKVIRLALSSEGYEILAVSDGKEAVKAIQQEKPDIVLIDIALPSGDAYAVKKQINDLGMTNSIRFILMSSAFEKIDEDRARDVIFDGRLSKPFDPGHLRKLVTQLLPAVGAPDQAEIVIVKPSMDAPGAAPLPPPPVFHDSGDQNDDEGEDIPPPPPVFDFTEQNEEEVEAGPDDIKGLTESTIKISGLDDFEWSLDDSSKMKAGTPPPLHQVTTPMNPARAIDDGGSNFLNLGLKQTASTQRPNPGPGPSPFAKHTQEKKNPLTAMPPIPGFEPELMVEKVAAAVPASSGLSRVEIEEIVRQELKATLEKLARDTVPQLAEKLLRQEIEKLLSE